MSTLAPMRKCPGRKGGIELLDQRHADPVARGHPVQRVSLRHHVDPELQQGHVRARQGGRHRVAVVRGHLELVPVGGRRGDEEVQLGVAGQQRSPGEPRTHAQHPQVHAPVQRDHAPYGGGRPTPSPGRSARRGRGSCSARGTGGRTPLFPVEALLSSSAPRNRCPGLRRTIAESFPTPQLYAAKRQVPVTEDPRSSPRASPGTPPWPSGRRASRPATGPCAARTATRCCA